MVRAAAAGAVAAAAVSDSLLDDSASEEAVDTGLAGGSCGCCGRREVMDTEEGEGDRTVASGCWRREIRAVMALSAAAGLRALIVT